MKSRLSIGMIIGLAFLTGLNPAVWSQQSPGTSVAADPPSAEAILDRYVEVTGGKEAYEKRISEVSRGKVEITSAGVSGSLESYARPGLHYISIDLAGIGKVEEGVKDGIAWENSLLQGPRIRTGDEREMALRDAAFNAPIKWREIYPTVETTGIESINGEDAYRVVQTPAKGNPVTTYYSVKSGLAIKSETLVPNPMGEVPMEAIIQEYREIEGVLYPVKMIQKGAGQTITLTIESVEINTDIPEERFNLPEAVQALVK